MFVERPAADQPLGGFILTPVLVAADVNPRCLRLRKISTDLRRRLRFRRSRHDVVSENLFCVGEGKSSYRSLITKMAWPVIPIICAALLGPLSASALIMTGHGNKPVRDPGWPEGALTVANLESRVGWWEGPPLGGGQWQFVYRGDTEAFTEALAAFAAIHAPVLELVIHDGPQEDSILKEKVDWSFTVWVPASWHRQFNNPRRVFGAGRPQFRQPVDPPRLDVYIGSGQVDWAKVKVPAGVTIRDEIKPDGGALLRLGTYDMATGKPVKDAHVILARPVGCGADATPEKVAEVVCDAAGHAEVANIPAGTYRVAVEAGGYAPRVLGNERFGGRTLKKFVVELAKSVTLGGTVTDGEGKPLKDVKVRATEVMGIDGRGYGWFAGGEVVTDENGRFALTGLPAGFTQVRAAAPGYHFTDFFTIHDAPATNVAVRLYRAGGIRITVTDKFGRALSRFDGKPLIVEVEPKEGNTVGAWGGSATVKDDGTFEFKNVPPGEYRINSRPNPANTSRVYAPEQVITVKAGEPVQVKVIYE